MIAAQPSDGPRDDTLALYVHWPFCVSKCPYCDFNSHVRTGIDTDAWRAALLADMAHEARAIGPARLSSIFFGGGTPSLMPPALVAAVIEAAAGHWQAGADTEITLEANPSSVETARLADCAAAGINRVSLGIQSFDDAELRFLGRAHGAGEAQAALATAQRLFDRVSFDLIYALPGQDAAGWRQRLAAALDRGTGHLSLYQLTIEPGTRFARDVKAGALVPLDDDRAADLYDLTAQMTEAAGLPAYEVSNHARPGQESRHNLAYWRMRPHAGIGPGAHGRYGGRATVRHRLPEKWLGAVATAGHGIAEERAIPPAERAGEALLMGLRLAEGVNLADIARDTGLPAARLLDMRAAARLEASGLLARDGDRLRVTPPGRLVLDTILAEIVTGPETGTGQAAA